MAWELINMTKFDVSIVIVTIARKNLLRSVRSVFAQKYSGKIQVLVGIDIDIYNQSKLIYQTLINECPENIVLTWIDLGYSTSVRHSGIHASFYGGSLRTAMSFLANSEYVVYLDDDDWFLENHVSSMLEIIKDHVWAFSYSYYADGNTSTPLCVDEIESVGVSQGVYAKKFGGFVRPSGLTLNKLKTMHLLHIWSMSLSKYGDGEDRLIFEHLRKLPHAFSKNATVCAAIDPLDGNHSLRKDFILSKGIQYSTYRKMDSSRAN